MKHFAKLLISIVLMGLAPLSSQAQGVTDAFYIYQNDGHFNGFFYDEVIEIRYSKLDTLNLEHSDFVSQEIVTADSTYRIMLAAIDSVGFVQPEVKYNPRLRLVSEDQLFYLESRGISRQDAEAMFVSATLEQAAIDAPVEEARTAVLRLGEKLVPDFGELFD